MAKHRLDNLRPTPNRSTAYPVGNPHLSWRARRVLAVIEEHKAKGLRATRETLMLRAKIGAPSVLDYILWKLAYCNPKGDD